MESLNKMGNAESGALDVPSNSRMSPLYARYVLVVLMIVYVFNYLDRQILAVLAEDIKADLGVSDAQLGFLFGTAFAVFYATFGITLGRLADAWNRKNLIALGLGFWSLVTAFSGFARGFVPLALCRFGVGIGESSATPAANSLLYDYFPPKVRTTVLAVYNCGVYIGAGLGLFLGGWILDSWNEAWPSYSSAPLGLRGWQAAFMVVGLPGLFMAFWVSTLREPVRGAMDGIISRPHQHPFKEAVSALITMVPLANLWVLSHGKDARRVILMNSGIGFIVTLAVGCLVSLTGDLLQWVAVGIGAYAAFSWAQGIANRDQVIFSIIFRCKTLLAMIFASGPVVFMGVALPFWAVSYFQRYHGINASEVGAILGAGSALMGFLGMLSGGVLADIWRKRNPRGKLYVWLGGMVTSILSALLFLLAENVYLAYAGIFMMLCAGAMASSPFLSTLNDLVLPRGRATVSAFATMVSTFIGVALGPYAVGLISDVFAADGVSGGEALRQAMLCSLLLPLFGVVIAIYAVRNIEEDEASILARARALGEDI